MSNHLLNYAECSFVNLTTRMFTFRDFAHEITNPYFLAYSNITKNSTDSDIEFLQPNSFYMIFFTACYAYSIFRIFMDLTKIIYSYKKIDIIFSDKKNQEIMKEKDHKGNKTPRVYEIDFYKKVIYFSVIAEFLMSVHNFFIWRGLQYYTSYLLYKDANCIYCTESIDLLSDHAKNSYMIIMILLWVTLDSFRMFVTYFSVLTLSRINRKEKSGKEFLRPNLIKSIGLAIVYWALIAAMIFIFDLPLYYRFFKIEVLCFWFFWKSLGFFLLFDRLHSKFWLFQNLKFQALHSHGIEWKKKLGKVKDTILYDDKNNGLIDKIRVILEQEKQTEEIDDFLYQKIKSILDSQGAEIQSIYINKIEEFYKNNIEKEIIDRYEEEKKSKLKTKWADYLNFILGLTLLGIIGYLFLLLDNTIIRGSETHFEDDSTLITNPYATYYIGIFFCYVEILICDLSHGIFLLHCFFIELFGFLKENQTKQNFSEMNEDNELIEFDPEGYDQIIT